MANGTHAAADSLGAPAEPLRDTWSDQTDWWLDMSLYDPLRRLRSQAARIAMWIGILVVPVVFYLFILASGERFSTRMWSYVNALSMSSGEYFGFVGILFTVLAILVGFQLASQVSSSGAPGPEEDSPSAVLQKVRQRVRGSFNVDDERVDKNSRADNRIGKAFRYRDGHRQAEARSELVENLARAGVFAVIVLSLPLVVSTLHEMRWGFALGILLCVTLGFALLTVSITVSDSAPRESWQADRMLNSATLVARAIDARRGEGGAREGGSSGGLPLLPVRTASLGGGQRAASARKPASTAANAAASRNGEAMAAGTAPATANQVVSGDAAAPASQASPTARNAAAPGAAPAHPGGGAADSGQAGGGQSLAPQAKSRPTANGPVAFVTAWERRIAAALAVALTLVACICINLSSSEREASGANFLLDVAFFSTAFASMSLSLREAMKLLAARRVNAASNTQNSLSQRFRFCLALFCAGFVLALVLTAATTVFGVSDAAWAVVTAVFLLAVALACCLVAAGCLRSDGQGKLRVGVRAMTEELLSERLLRAVVVITSEIDSGEHSGEQPASPVSLVGDSDSDASPRQERQDRQRRETRVGRRSTGGAHTADSRHITVPDSSALGA
ncbi:MAG: hypothetical protein Q3979_09455 [Actinomycetaceae bacterium]|nr:hypothetical protein [Actinomycetaceae bacterium]